MKKKNITLKDIAKEAEVSVTTASFYINGLAEQYHLADKTCDRIGKIIKKHNYMPNIHARAINSKKTYLIGVIAGAINFSFWADIIAGIEDEITQHQYHMVLAISHFDLEKQQAAFSFMETKAVDGYLFSPVMPVGKTMNFDFIQDLETTKPIVCINYKSEGIESAYNDNEEGGRIVARYLFKQGHRQVAYIGKLGKVDRRGIGFMEEFAKLSGDPKHFEFFIPFFKEWKKFTAVFCFTDYYLVKFYDKAAKHGIKIPEDISVIGYDNMDFLEQLSPRPTTINQYKKEVGAAAASLLISLIKDEKPPKTLKKRFIPTLVKRDSVLNINKSRK